MENKKMKKQDGIKVSLIAHSNQPPEMLASSAALTCYQGNAPEWERNPINLQSRIIATGHHTVIQHLPLTFQIEGIAIGDVTFGLHLASTFYNSSQRSGRFCASMFANPDIDSLMAYIEKYWPKIEQPVLDSIKSYIRFGLNVYQQNIDTATDVARQFIKEERPNAGEKYIEANGPKFAQEQLRNFIPVIFPTALTYTINLSALSALYATAWTPPLRDLTQKMVDCVIRRWPCFESMFARNDAIYQRFSGVVGAHDPCGLKVLQRPELSLVHADVPTASFLNSLKSHKLHPLDPLQFSPLLMDGNVSSVKTEISLSVATMGQDQRHRTIGRSYPDFTGGFYLPPVAVHLNMQSEAMETLERWNNLVGKIPVSLASVLAPYGAMVRYEKTASWNALLHEQGKRLCWCAQEEISYLALSLRNQLLSRIGEKSAAFNYLSPACMSNGKCGEGVRCCGRNLTQISTNPFPKRRV
jgi:hypothetical protein